MAGAGTIPGGTGPFGIGTPAEASERPTGAAGVRFINPDTRDYEQDPSTSQLAQMPSVRQRVMLALVTEFGSSGVDGFGFKRPPKMGTGFERVTELAVRTALRQLTDVERIIRVDQVLVDRLNTQRARINVTFTNLETGKQDTAQA
jgi:hypothetical protein